MIDKKVKVAYHVKYEVHIKVTNSTINVSTVLNTDQALIRLVYHAISGPTFFAGLGPYLDYCLGMVASNFLIVT